MQRKMKFFLLIMLFVNSILLYSQPSGCIALSNVDQSNSNITLYSDSSGGYAAGSNGNGDIAMSERFDLADHGICYPSTITSFQICANVDAGTTGNITAAIWNESANLPNNIIASVTQPAMSLNLTDQNGDGAITTADCTTINFNTAVSVNGPFYIGLTGLNTLTGGNLGIYTNSDPESVPATAYEQTTSGWMCFDNSLSLDVDISMFIFPSILPQAPTVAINLPTSSNFCDDGTTYPFTSTTSICSGNRGTTPTYAWKVMINNNIIATSTASAPSFSFSTSGNHQIELCVTGTFCEMSCVTETIFVSDCGPSCPPNYTGANAISGNETGTGGINSDGDFETDGIITSTQTIVSGNIDYDSAIEINMLAGFEVTLGSVFCAFIDGCNGTGGVVNPLIEENDQQFKASETYIQQDIIETKNNFFQDQSIHPTKSVIRK